VTATFENNVTGVSDDAATASVTPAEARQYCRALAQTHYENFPVVSWLLPRRLHQHFYNVYAYCRTADDLGDEHPDPHRSLALLGWWRDQLAQCYAGAPQHPVFIALKETIDEFHIPQRPFEDLIAAFEQDQRVRDYDTFAQLGDYCTRSANPVGVLVLYLSGAHNARNVAWSDSICTGLQLANFWQDVARDLDIGRVYLPREDRERFGYTDEELRGRQTTPAFLDLMRFEVDRARGFLLAGRPLVEHVPLRLQIDVELFIRGGLKILERIEDIGYRVWETRPVVAKRDFARLFLRSAGRTALRRLHLSRRTEAAADRIENAGSCATSAERGIRNEKPVGGR
jgi:squalene synthase HpnC